MHNVDKAQCKVRNKKDNVAGNQAFVISLKSQATFSFGLEAEIHLLLTQKKSVCLVC